MTELTDALRAFVADLPNRPGRRLSFAQQCAAFYAVRAGAPQHLVAKALGVTSVTLSRLANCLDNRAYPRVAKAWRELGEEDFGARFYADADLHKTIMTLRAGLAQSGRHLRAGADPAADRYAGEFAIGPDRLVVAWAPKNPPWNPDWSDDLDERRYAEKEGWSWGYADRRPLATAFFNSTPYVGMRFRTSRQAYEHAHASHGAVAPD